MTCIAGAVGPKGLVVIGGDSAGVGGGYSLEVRKDRKVFQVGEFIMGFTSSFRMGQILNYAFVPPRLPRPARALNRYMVVDFVDALRKALKDKGFASKEHEVEAGGTFLVGVRGRLFQISDDYQVGEALSGFDAVGCGSELARGALYATPQLPARERVRIALEASEAGSAGVRAPFYYVTLPGLATKR
jgi:ATP-dependent protease HslVU (ClpYQ) peptidase subunit